MIKLIIRSIGRLLARMALISFGILLMGEGPPQIGQEVQVNFGVSLRDSPTFYQSNNNYVLRTIPEGSVGVIDAVQRIEGTGNYALRLSVLTTYKGPKDKRVADQVFESNPTTGEFIYVHYNPSKKRLTLFNTDNPNDGKPVEDPHQASSAKTTEPQTAIQESRNPQAPPPASQEFEPNQYTDLNERVGATGVAPGECPVGDFKKFINKIDYAPGSYYKPDTRKELFCKLYNKEICAAYKKATGKDIGDLDTFYFIKAIVRQESGFDPNAFRIENADFRNRRWMGDNWSNYLKQEKLKDNSTEIKKFESSYGLMQMLFVTAYFDHGFRGKPEDLLQPENALKYGIKHLMVQLKKADEEIGRLGKTKTPAPFSRWQAAAARYNSGSIQLLDDGVSLFCHDSYVNSVNSFMKSFKSSCPFESIKEACEAK